MIFETERLLIRNLQESDFAPFHAMHSKTNVMKYTGDNVKTSEEDKADIERLIHKYSLPDNNFWVWAIIRKTDNQFIGTCAIIIDDERLFDPTKHEIGYRLDEPYWGNGYASEITPALIEYGFNQLGITELMAEVDELNIASVRVLDKYMTYLKTQYSEKFKSNDRIYIIRKT